MLSIFFLCLNWDPEDINVNSFLSVSRCLKIFSFLFFSSLSFCLLLRLGNSIALSSSLLILSFVIASLLSPSCEVLGFFPGYCHFQSLNFHLVLFNSVYFFTESFYFICYKRIHNCLLKHFHHGCL